MALSRNDGEALSATRKSVIHIHRPIAIAVLEMCRGGKDESPFLLAVHRGENSGTLTVVSYAGNPKDMAYWNLEGVGDDECVVAAKLRELQDANGLSDIEVYPFCGGSAAGPSGFVRGDLEQPEPIF
ncbi:g9180 [Coccomyxa viridis]|uniref:G9180 protein n=1 Tax=Coccomyxa viridis TaxID=1274662 RepID=A0ABP1G921_9CHLO